MRSLHIGLGDIGSAVAHNLHEKGREVVGFDTAATVREQMNQQGIACYEQLSDAVEAASVSPRIVLVAIPAQHVTNLLDDLATLLTAGDIVIDVGNSFFSDSINHYHQCANTGIRFIDCGLLGGAGGARRGASLLLGGDETAIHQAVPVLQTVARGEPCRHVGGPGAGHFAKMVHNAIEYSMMGAIAEGFHILDEHKEGLELDLEAILEPYTRGSVIQGRLVSWLHATYQQDKGLQSIAHSVPPEHRDMNMEYLTKHEVARILDAALMQRKLTRLEPSIIGTIINAMRSRFGDTVNLHQTDPVHIATGNKTNSE